MAANYLKAATTHSSQLHQVFDQLNVEEKFSILDALVSTSDTVFCSNPGASSFSASSRDHIHCNICEESFQSYIQYFGHLKNHKELKLLWVCARCPSTAKTFSSLSLLERHEKCFHGMPIMSRKLKYSNANYSTSSSSALDATSLTLIGKTTALICQLCGKRFQKQSDLRNHVAAHLSFHFCLCEVCGRSFSHISNLIRHSRIHSGFHPYLCKVCGKRFKQASALSQHTISHHDNISIPCPALPLECHKTFRTPVIAKQHALRQHPEVVWDTPAPVLTKTKQRCFYCRSCGEKFPSANKLKGHTMMHSAAVHRSFEAEDLVKNISNKKEERNGGSLFTLSNERAKSASNHSYVDLMEKQEQLTTTALSSKIEDSYDSFISRTVSSEWCRGTACRGLESDDDKMGIEREGQKSMDHDSTVQEPKVNNSGVSHDVIMGLCPDSPNNSLDSNQLPKLHCFHVEDGLHHLANEDTFENMRGLNSHSKEVKSPSGHDGYHCEERTMLSFGDGYLSLLKEIGIIDECKDDSRSVCESVKHGEVGKEKRDEPFLSDLWDTDAELREGAKEDKGVSYTLAEDNGSQKDEPVDSLSIKSEEILLYYPIQVSEKLIKNKNVDVLSDQMSSNLGEATVSKLPFSSRVVSNGSHISEDPVKVDGNFASTHYEHQDSKNRLESFKAFDSNLVAVACKLEKNAPELLEFSSTLEKNPNEVMERKRETNYDALKKNSDPIQVNACFVASLETTFRKDLNHIKKTPNRAKKTCPECGKIFSRASNLTQHIGLHFPDKKVYKCSKCSQSFSWKSSLNKHMLLHSNVLKPFLCDVCGKQYKTFDQVKQHKERDHQSLRPNSCEVCEKSFFRKYDLQVHQRIHNQGKPFLCDTCGKTFNHLSHVKRHRRVHFKTHETSVALQ